MKTVMIFPNWLGRSGNYCHSAAIKLGFESHLIWGSDHEVLTFTGFLKDKARRAPFISARFKKIETQVINRTVTEKIKKIRPDIVINNCPTLLPETIQTLRDYSKCNIFWAGDDPSLFRNLMKSLHLYDFFFSGSPYWIDRNLLSIRKTQNFYLPYGFEPGVFHQLPLSKREQANFGNSIAFVGARYADRENFLLHFANYDLGIWGWKKDNFLRRSYRKLRGRRHGTFNDKYGTDAEFFFPVLNRKIRGSFIDNITANKVYNASSILLNLQHPQIVTALNPKTFEIAGAGAFQLLQHSGDLLEQFEKEKEIVCFHSLDDCKEKINYYLQHEQERNEIAKRAQQRAARDHTFIKRLEYILSIVGKS